ncbi:MBL fold metallo-hydrolase [Saccharopolyspora rhizosphaerae]|uniref:MBL fold metallo-hydrolase n=1 Tax=Saccharopolyspora rhizosphaerae TaxID=2492662 RepID=A0A426K1F7_9PSEU|nr:MBL fold metallo-hydrolase [Saccharopolyspora rhizosphaerae]RRO19367.1 MBL fold metallo-hydrolase [Saccharopolyspora rhizosphaerae]
MGNAWIEVADRVFARRHTELDLTTGLVVGEESALVVDTRGDHRQGADLAEAVRAITRLPVQVAITHGHFDHCFGTSAFLPAPVWAHERCPEFLTRTAAEQRRHWVEHYRERGDTGTAEALATSTPAQPDHLVTGTASLNLGGREVHLHHFGPGHTDHDLVAEVPDAAVVFAGDLVEHGAPPDFEDARPAHWPSTVDAVLALHPTTVVPGHGDPVGPGFVHEQAADLARLAEVCAGLRPPAESPFPDETTQAALDRSAQ